MTASQTYIRNVLALSRPRFWRELVLSLGAILGTLCIVLTIASVGFDVKPLIFRSGSMTPTIETGTLAFAKEVPAGELKVGDIVSVNDAKRSRVTHRIAQMDGSGEKASLTLKGDANDVPDAHPYVVESADRVLFSVPKLGYVVSWLSGPAGTFVAGLIVGLVLLFLLWRRPNDGRDPGGSRKATHSGIAMVVGAGLLASTAVVEASPTQAAWTDVSTLASGPIAAYSVPQPAITNCTIASSGLLGTTKTAQITFAEVSSPYPLNYKAVRTDTGATVPITDLGSTRRADFTVGVLGTVIGTYTVRITASLPSPNDLWVSGASNQTVSALLTLVSCGAPETTPPAITFTAPTNGVKSKNSPYRDVVRDACGSNTPGCGQISDASGIKSVTYRFKRVIGASTEYFHASSASGGIWNSDATFEAAQFNDNTWSFDGLITTAYFDRAGNENYTLEVTAVDNANNSATRSITFTLID